MEPDVTTGRHQHPSTEQFHELFQLIGGYRVSQALYVVARLEIADLLRDGPRGSDELAQLTETHPGALYRILRFLAGVGIFTEVAPTRFALTPLGAGLRSDFPQSIRPNILMLLGEHNWRSWGRLLHSVQTGETAFEQVHGVDTFEFFRRHPTAADAFNLAMTANTARSGGAILRDYDFSGIERLVDVGGGHGLLLATVLQAHPSMRGVLFDSPAVIEGAQPVLVRAGVVERVEIVGGDFFASVPAGGDAYVLRQIIHDWDDIRAAQILSNCRRAMRDSGKLLVLERAIGDDYQASVEVLHIDLEMLVNLGGIQRTTEQFRALFSAAAFHLSAVIPIEDGTDYCVFEGTPI